MSVADVGSGAASGAMMGTMVSPGMGTAIGAGVGALGSIVGGLLGQSGQAASNAQQFAQQELLFNQQQASIPAAQIQAEQNAWSLRGTAYQETMRDMKAAGLNPILAANLGANTSGVVGGIGASVPQSSPVGNAGALLGQGVASAAQAGQTYMQLRALDAQASKDQSTTDYNKASTDFQKSQTAVADVTKDKVLQDTTTSATAAEANKAAADRSRAEAAAAGTTAAYNVAKTLTEGHNANTAFQKSRVAQQEADNAVKYGPGAVGSSAADISRTGSTVHSWLDSLLGRITDTARSAGVSEELLRQRGTPPTVDKSERPLYRSDLPFLKR